MRLRAEKSIIALITALFLSQVSLALTADGRLSTQARNALWFLKIKKTEIDDADSKPLGLERSVRLLLMEMKLQASDNPAAGPIAPLNGLSAIQQVVARAKLKNPNLPKIAIADLPAQLVTALKAAGIIKDDARWATPTQMVAWLLNRSVVLQLQNELNKLGNPLVEPGLTATRNFWMKLDTATENLSGAYLDAIVRNGNPFVQPTPVAPPNQVTRGDLQNPFGLTNPPAGNQSTLPDPFTNTDRLGSNQDFIPHGRFDNPLDGNTGNTHGGAVGERIITDRFGRRHLVLVNADGTFTGIGANNRTLNR